jgi:fused signal recognition particle receptor
MVFNFVKSGYNKIKNALIKTRSILGAKISSLFSGKIDEDTLEQLEQLLYEADVGVQTATELTKTIRDCYAKNPEMKPADVVAVLKEEMTKELSKNTNAVNLPKDMPLVILVVGVNGNGKTTSVAKLAKQFKMQGKQVLVAAADTFRAGAIHQLEIWAERIQIDIVKGAPKSDPSSVVFDALSAAISRKSDVVIIDTAGRLHTKTDLMQELEKIKRTCKKLIPESPHETLLVLDATTGQNAIDQARIFNQYTPITGIVLTKLDGTAKGGIVLNLQKQLGIPVKFIGIGENMDDLEHFNADSFVNALFD